MTTDKKPHSLFLELDEPALPDAPAIPPVSQPTTRLAFDDPNQLSEISAAINANILDFDEYPLDEISLTALSAEEIVKPKSSPPPPPAKPAPPPTPAKPAPRPPATPPAPFKATTGLLGNILVENRLLTNAQRDAVLQLQRQSGHAARFGQLAIQQGLITEADLQRALAAQKKFVQNVQREQSRAIRLPEEVARVGADIASLTTASSAKINKWLASAAKYGASDLHIMAGHPLVLRHGGRLIKSREQALTADDTYRTLTSILSESEREVLKTQHAIVTCLTLKDGTRVRGSVYRHMGGYNGTFRIIPAQVPSLVSLHLPSQIAKFTAYAQGLVLITGPIGCGKTTTMAALIDIVNQERQDHIITVERPIEFVHKNMRSLVTQREVGTHTRSFSDALRAALREDPDVIAVGEMNNIETARLAVTAAETGHLVFATLHTENAVRTVNRVLDIFPPEEQGQVRSMLSESLRGVICQRLVPRSDEPGLIPAVELLFTTPAMRNLIRDQKVHQLPNAIRMSRNVGNRTLPDYAQELFEQKRISQETYEQLCQEEA
ncbi:MAG: PilT/PilU family type 4a pilus ATPase [Myxococcales bacterium]|nr:PilT/PilU family type 4a pilus ATPase [Myxococcales bacterium]